MKMKRNNLHDEMLLDGTVYFGRHSDGRMFENGKPIEPKASDMVVRPTPKLNVAPKPTDPPAPTKRKQSQATGLMRAIEANVANNGKPVHTTTSNFKPTGLLRAIEANIRDKKSKPKTDEHDN